MPRTGSVWLDAVCLVPNWVSRRMVASIRLGSICLINARRAGSKCPVFRAEPMLAGAARAGPACEARGTATAVTAEAERNARRLGRFEPDASGVSMPLNQDRDMVLVKSFRPIPIERKRTRDDSSQQPLVGKR